MTHHYFEDLKFAVEVFEEGGNLVEVLARPHDLDAARAPYEACRNKYPKRLLYLSQGGGSCDGATVMTAKCARCEDTYWVCEDHDDRPSWDHPRACTCGAPGMPCPSCNRDDPPRPFPGFRVTIDKGGRRQ